MVVLNQPKKITIFTSGRDVYKFQLTDINSGEFFESLTIRCVDNNIIMEIE